MSYATHQVAGEFQLLKNYCERNAYTYTHGQTAFIASKVGPIRAIRSIVGANSGVLTVRNNIMYEQLEETITSMRVHPIPGLMYYMNFKKDTPLTFYNCKNKKGFDVSGQMDENEKNFDKNFCDWEMVTGPSGTYLRTIGFDLAYHLPSEDPGLFLESWYYDNANPVLPGSSYDKLNIPFNNAPVHLLGENDPFALCSYFSNKQNEAWGTMGFKTKPMFEWTFHPNGTYASGLGVPNTDPLFQFNWDKNVPCQMPEFPLGTSSIQLKTEVKSSSFYLPPEVDVTRAEEIANDKKKVLKTKVTGLP